MPVRYYDIFAIILIPCGIVGYFCLPYELFRTLCLIIMFLQLSVFLYCHRVDLMEERKNDKNRV